MGRPGIGISSVEEKEIYSYTINEHAYGSSKNNVQAGLGCG